jgi:hypothetical protein
VMSVQCLAAWLPCAPKCECQPPCTAAVRVCVCSSACVRGTLTHCLLLGTRYAYAWQSCVLRHITRVYIHGAYIVDLYAAYGCQHLYSLLMAGLQVSPLRYSSTSQTKQKRNGGITGTATTAVTP